MELIILFFIVAAPAYFIFSVICFLLGFTKAGDIAERKQDATKRINL